MNRSQILVACRDLWPDHIRSYMIQRLYDAIQVLPETEYMHQWYTPFKCSRCYTPNLRLPVIRTQDCNMNEWSYEAKSLLACQQTRLHNNQSGLLFVSYTSVQWMLANYDRSLLGEISCSDLTNLMHATPEFENHFQMHWFKVNRISKSIMMSSLLRVRDRFIFSQNYPTKVRYVLKH